MLSVENKNSKKVRKWASEKFLIRSKYVYE